MLFLFYSWIVHYSESKEVVRTLGGTLWGVGTQHALSICCMSGVVTCCKNPEVWVSWSPPADKVAGAQGN